MGNANFIYDEDASYVNRLKEGDAKAYEYLFKKYYAALCAYARRYVELEYVEDIADDCMTWLWEKRASLDIRCTFRQYIFSMVYHRSIKVAVDQNIADKTAAYLADYRMRHKLDDNDFLLEQELRSRIRMSLDSLPDTYREAFIRHRFEGKSYKEIAELCGMSVKTVDYRIQQALKRLRKDLKDYLPAITLAIVMGYLECDASLFSSRPSMDFRNVVTRSTDARYCSVNV